MEITSSLSLLPHPVVLRNNDRLFHGDPINNETATSVDTVQDTVPNNTL